MALLQNITINAQYPIKRFGATATASESAALLSTLGFRVIGSKARFFSEASYSNKAAIPYGYSPAFYPALKDGALSSINEIRGSGSFTSAISMGKNMEASIAGVGDITTPSLSMVVYAASTIAGTGALTASMSGSINLVATLAGQGELTSALKIIANCVATITANGSVDANLTGTARLEADIYVNQSEASVQQLVAGVWNALAASYNESGTLGEKLNSAGTAGDPWTADLDDYATPGTAGKKLNDSLTSGQFIALK